MEKSKRNVKVVDGPKVFVLAQTQMDFDGVDAWMSHLGGTAHECLQQMTGPGSEKLIELAGRRCYKAFGVDLNPNVTRVRTDSTEYIGNILGHAHGSVLEHSSITFAVEDVSRVVTHETVRHRAGTAFSQESLRYVRFGSEMKIWLPKFIKEDSFIMDKVLGLMSHVMEVYAALEEHTNVDTTKTFKVKKWVTSALRRFVPMGIATGIVVTFNLRALRWFIEQRSNEHAEIEVQLVADQLAQIAKRRFPAVFQDMEATEGPDELGMRVQHWSFKNRKV